MRYLIIGNGVAGVTAAFTIRARAPKASIMVVSGESDYFFSRTALMYAFMDRLRRRDLEPFERELYERQGIERIRDWVIGLDADAQRVTLRGGELLAYDRLLLATGSRPNRPDWPGLEHARDGAANFVSLQDLDVCERLTKMGQQAVVVGGGLIGVELVECLRHHGMEVTFLVREPWYWPAALGRPEGNMISEHIARHGVRVVHGESVESVDTDENGRVMGVVGPSGGKYPCSMLGIAIGVRPATEWLASVKTPPYLGRGVVVDEGFRTSLPNVYACGDCAEVDGIVEQIWYAAKRQGELAGRAMVGDSVSYRPPLFYNSAKFFEVEYTTVGSFGEGASEFYARVPGREASVRIAERHGAVTGFNMLGSRWDHTVLERWVGERRSADYVIERLHEAQFDVEFGRVKLSPQRVTQ